MVTSIINGVEHTFVDGKWMVRENGEWVEAKTMFCALSAKIEYEEDDQAIAFFKAVQELAEETTACTVSNVELDFLHN
jgi:hypothetical protein